MPVPSDSKGAKPTYGEEPVSPLKEGVSIVDNLICYRAVVFEGFSDAPPDVFHLRGAVDGGSI